MAQLQSVEIGTRPGCWGCDFVPVSPGPLTGALKSIFKILNHKATLDSLLTDTANGQDAHPPTLGTLLLELPSQVDRGPWLTTRRVPHTWLLTVHL